MNTESASSHRPRQSGGRRKKSVAAHKLPASRTAPEAGRFKPLTDSDVAQIHEASLDILENIGLSDAPQGVIEIVCRHGGKHTSDGRLTFPRPLVTTALQQITRKITLCGRAPGRDIELSGAKVHTGSGGASPQVVDLESGSYRAATLNDLYDAARLVDTLEHVQFFSRSMIASDMPDSRSLDLNTAFASLAGTSKHVIVSISHASHVHDIAQICYAIAGSEGAFRDRPFLSVNINHVVPPLRFDPDACDVMTEAITFGLPVMVNTFGQMGASSPVTIAGCLAQTNAETLAGMVFAWARDPDVRAIYGARPMVTDLRTGGMAGGSGEQAILTAAATQMARFYNLPNSTIAGATDSKLADAQSGFEKSMAITMAVQAGANLITQAAGTQAGLLATSMEAYVVDNDMLGAILRSASPVEVNATTLSTNAIAEAVQGEGHFLGHTDTYARMKSDFVYPEHADRQAPEAWIASGAPTINTTAKEAARRILATHFPCHISAETEQELRARFDIRLTATRTQNS
ncbi:trimethylamine---corrinoid protein Co-methyltransferase [Shimia gijangensis]|uniref:Methyltransferase n=1 Tax=Shimia gijangensis TaxID=1470563 RepID=A0A1M6C9L4_9RHOB|nr:trimethylamine---corrinoid protein Co-methyltransferase [Shimia gijangensis]